MWKAKQPEFQLNLMKEKLPAALDMNHGRIVTFARCPQQWISVRCITKQLKIRTHR